MFVIDLVRRELPEPAGRSLLDPDGAPVTLEQSLSYAAKFAGAVDPEGVMRDIARGEAVPEQVAAFRQNWGELYEQLRVDVLGALTDMGERRKLLPVERQRQIDEYLELDGAANHAFSSRVARHIEQARAMSTPQPNGGAGPRHSTAFQTRAAAAAVDRARV